MFVDEVEIEVESGHGGPGAMSFRREKFVPRGGPDGGDGGRGGDVRLLADPSLGTLLDFRHHRRFKAANGKPGQGSRKFGKSGEDEVIRVPVGTVVTDLETGRVVADLVAEGESVVVVEGGRGGRGNYRFRSATNQAPRYSQPGGEAHGRRLKLTLKLIADVGLVGLPNAGKSTFLSVISRARPKVANYPFTTLVPNLGLVPVADWQSMVVADLPGIVEGAHHGRGLGHRFLRHIERTRVLAILIDSVSPDPAAVYATLLDELGRWSPTLLRKPRVLVYTKIDTIPDPSALVALDETIEWHAISSVTGKGVRQLVRGLHERVRALDATDATEATDAIEATEATDATDAKATDATDANHDAAALHPRPGGDPAEEIEE
jgi:GTP-binding protein